MIISKINKSLDDDLSKFKVSEINGKHKNDLEEQLKSSQITTKKYNWYKDFNSQHRLPSLYQKPEGDIPINGIYNNNLTISEVADIAYLNSKINHDFGESTQLDILLNIVEGGTTQYNIVQQSIYFPIDVDIKKLSNMLLQGKPELINTIIEFLKPKCLYIAKSSSGVGFFFLVPVFGLEKIRLDIKNLRKEVGSELERYFNDLIYPEFGLELEFDFSQYEFRKIRRFGSPQYNSQGELVKATINKDCDVFEISDNTINEFTLIQQKSRKNSQNEESNIITSKDLNLCKTDGEFIYKYNQNISCKDILSVSYTEVGTNRMNRIGGDSKAISLLLNDNIYYNYNPNDPFYDDKIGTGPYRAFDAYRLIHHKGNYVNALKQLKNEK